MTEDKKQVELKGSVIAGEPTANGRIYSREVLEAAIVRARARIDNRTMLGGLSQRPDGKTSLNAASHVVTDLRLNEEGNLIGSVKVLDTTQGKLLQMMLDRNKDDYELVPRGVGSVGSSNVVGPDYILTTVDVLPKATLLHKPPSPTIREERIPLLITSTTLVGYVRDGESAPYLRGNCASIGNSYGNSYACANMHAANIRAALCKWPELASGVDVLVTEVSGRKLCKIVDRRIPDEWLQHSCSCCTFPESKE